MLNKSIREKQKILHTNLFLNHISQKEANQKAHVMAQWAVSNFPFIIFSHSELSSTIKVFNNMPRTSIFSSQSPPPIQPVPTMPTNTHSVHLIAGKHPVARHTHTHTDSTVTEMKTHIQSLPLQPSHYHHFSKQNHTLPTKTKNLCDIKILKPLTPTIFLI